MTKIKKILMAIGAALAAAGEAILCIFFFERKTKKLENKIEDLENSNKAQDAALKADEVYQEEQRKNEELKQKVNTDYGSVNSVNAAVSLMHNNQQRSDARKNT